LTTFVFDVPVDAKDLRLLVADADPMASLIIDHENSPLYGKIFMAVGAKSSAAASTNSK
jgi:hypothetical protein